MNALAVKIKDTFGDSQRSPTHIIREMAHDILLQSVVWIDEGGKITELPKELYEFWSACVRNTSGKYIFEKTCSSYCFWYSFSRVEVKYVII